MDDQNIGVGKGSRETKPLCGHRDSCVPFLRQCHNVCFILYLDASQDEVKKQLLQEEIAAVKAGIPQLHVTGPTAFVSLGLLVEENQ